MYAYAFNLDKDFYSFYRSLDAYKNSFFNKSDVIILSLDSEFFKYFKKSLLC